MNEKIVNVTHITHTDIRVDSRILKELYSIGQVDCYNVKSIGVDLGGQNIEMHSESLYGVEVVSLWSRKIRLFPSFLRYGLIAIELYYKLTLIALRNKPDILHCHDANVLLIGVIVKLKTGCKLIYDAHELESERNSQSKFNSRLTYLVEKNCWNKIDLLITVSESIEKWYIDNFGNKDSLIILNSPLLDMSTSDAKKYNNSYFHNKYNLRDTDLICVYLGMLRDGRGIDICLNAFKGLSSIHVVFIGSGHLDQYINRQSEKYPNIHLHDPVKHDHVVDVVSKADFCVCMIENASLSYYYCLPNKLFECSFAGLPVIASNFPDMSRYVNQYDLGVTVYPNASSLKKILIRIEKGEIRKDGFLSRDIKNISWTAQHERLQGAYKNLLLC